MVLECSQKVEGIGFVGVTHGKVINDQGEADVTGGVLSEARGKRAGLVSMWEYHQYIRLYPLTLETPWPIHVYCDNRGVIECIN